MMLVLTDIKPVVVAASSRWSEGAICAAKPLQGKLGCIFHLILKPLGFFGAPIKLLTVKTLELELEYILRYMF